MSGERECNVSVGRRQFLKRAVVGSALMVSGATDLYFNYNKRDQIYDKAKREVEIQGITPTGEEALNTVQQTRYERAVLERFHEKKVKVLLN